MEIKELQGRMYKFTKEHTSGGAFQKKEVLKELKEIAEDLMNLLEDDFILKIETYYENEWMKKLSKVINGKTYEGKGFFWGEAYGIEATEMNKEIFMKNLEDIFPLGFNDFQFEDSKKIITLTHDGDLKIEVK